jgi:co-chaperonin GroES (HSP10)
MVNKEFIEETDKIIQKIRERQIYLENGNVLVAKVKVEQKTAGGLILSEESTKTDNYQNGFGRILALPPMQEGDAGLKVGDFIFHSHEARYKIFDRAIRECLDYLVEKDLIYSVQDSDVIFRVPKEMFS